MHVEEGSAENNKISGFKTENVAKGIVYYLFLKENVLPQNMT